MATLVQRYCTPAGGGLHDGTSWANAWTAVEAWANAVAGQQVNIAGSFAPTAILSNTQVNVAWTGWKSDQSRPAESFSEAPVFDFVGLASGSALLVGSRSSMVGFRFLNAPSYVQNSAANDGQSFILCELVDCVSGIGSDNGLVVALCRFDGCTAGWVITCDFGPMIVLNEFVNSTRTIDTGSGVNGQCVGLNYFDDTKYDPGVAMDSGAAWGNTFNGADAGFHLTGGSDGAVAFLNIFSNNTTAIEMAAVSSILLADVFNNFYNNGADYGTGTFAAPVGAFAVDPDYEDIGANDYNINEATLQRFGLGGLAQAMNIGAAQTSASGGSVGGSYRPRITRG